MTLTNQEYEQLNKRYAKNSKSLRNIPLAFFVGGSICAFGQWLVVLYQNLGLEKDIASGCCSMTLVVISALLTGLNQYDNLAKHAGAGTLVPITGFANAMVSPALEFKTEGLILGIGGKMFVIAGPVLVYGISASVLYGVILFFTGLY